MSDVLPYVEAFGPTIQGEGPAAGRLSAFLRLGGCNLSCSWCDSAYTWDASRYNLREEIQLLTVPEILERTPEAPIIVLTGGEPLINQQNPAFISLLKGLKTKGHVHMETNGTIPPTLAVQDVVTHFSVSPKLANAGPHKKNQNPALSLFWQTVHSNPNTEAHLKFVVETPEDITNAVRIAERHKWPRERVWVMPEGTTAEVLNSRYPMVATEATKHRINASHRLHVLAWTDVRGH